MDKNYNEAIMLFPFLPDNFRKIPRFTRNKRIYAFGQSLNKQRLMIKNYIRTLVVNLSNI